MQSPTAGPAAAAVGKFLDALAGEDGEEGREGGKEGGKEGWIAKESFDFHLYVYTSMCNK